MCGNKLTTRLIQAMKCPPGSVYLGSAVGYQEAPRLRPSLELRIPRKARICKTRQGEIVQVYTGYEAWEFLYREMREFTARAEWKLATLDGAHRPHV